MNKFPMVTQFGCQMLMVFGTDNRMGVYMMNLKFSRGVKLMAH